MRAHTLFLLIYSGALNLGVLCSAQQNGCASGLTQRNCTTPPDPTADFLVCVGVPEDPGAGEVHVLNLKGLLDAVLDVFFFMRSSLSAAPVLELDGKVMVSSASLLQNQDFIEFWLEARLTPLLLSVSEQFLTCLSNSNFDCNTYQTVVQQLTQHYSGMDPVRQKWIYSFFMFPFLSRNSSAGCVDPNGTSEDWLLRNFGSFLVHGQIRDFNSINIYFSGMEVLNLLTPEQHAELVLNPDLLGVDGTSLSLVMESLLNSVTSSSSNGSMWTTDLPTFILPSPQDPLSQVMNNVMMAFKPVGSFVREFVSLTNQPDLSSATFVQSMLNWTLAELAAPYKQNSSSASADPAGFDPADVNAWFTHVVAPVLRRFLPGEIPSDLISVFHSLYYINTGSNGNTGGPDICSVTLETPECALNDLMEHVVKVLQCADTAHLTLTSQTLENLTLHLTTSLSSLLNQLSVTNFSGPDSPLSDVLNRIHNLSSSNLQDKWFVSTWFQIKLKPHLSQLNQDYLSCLSQKPFSCQTFQILVKGMSESMSLIGQNDELVLKFIFAFLYRSPGACMANSSSEWILLNLAGFSHLVPVWQLYQLNVEFNALEALDVLTSRQIAELVVQDLHELPNKTQVINAVFDFVLDSPTERNLPEILQQIIILAQEVEMNCSSYQQILKRLSTAVVPLEMMKIVQDTINTLSLISPAGCVTPGLQCPVTPVNETELCKNADSAQLQSLLISGGSIESLCRFSIYNYSCANVDGLTELQLFNLLQCKLSSDEAVYPKDVWKLFLTKVSGVLDGALVLLSRNVNPVTGLNGAVVLEVIAEMRLNDFSPDQWASGITISDWMGFHLKPLLPSVTGVFLDCLSSKNLTCQSYQNILPVFSQTFSEMEALRKALVVKLFILPVLTSNSTGGCVSSDSADWLSANFGLFSQYVTVKQLMLINRNFSPLLALSILTPLQLAELIVEDLPGLPDKNTTISRVFDFLLALPRERRLAEVLQGVSELSRTMPPSCAVQQILFSWLEIAVSSSLGDLEPVIWASVYSLSHTAPTGCPLFPVTDQCSQTPFNDTAVCYGVQSSSVDQNLANRTVPLPCNLSIPEYACAMTLNITSDELVCVLESALMNSRSPASIPAWKLLVSKASAHLDSALLALSSQVLVPGGQQALALLDALREVRVDRFSAAELLDVGFVSSWFGDRLRPLLSSASGTFLTCLSRKSFSCQTFQSVVQVFDGGFSRMDPAEQKLVSNFFIYSFLSGTSGPVCASNDSLQWLLNNFGKFSAFFPLKILISLNPFFNPLDVLDRLTLDQLVELMASPGLIFTTEQVNQIMENVPDSQFYQFFTSLHSALKGVVLPGEVQGALLQQILTRANLSDPTAPDWIGTILPSFISAITPTQIPQYYNLVQNTPCSISQQAVALLNSSASSFNSTVLQTIYNETIASLQGPEPLRCYGNQSFYLFLQSTFMSFGFPPLSVFLSIMPPGRLPQLLSSISPAELYSFLSKPGSVDNITQLCQIFDNYQRTAEFLQNEPVVSAAVGRQTLGCVWSGALRASSLDEVDQWFNVRLVQYLPFLSSQLISSTQLSGASCLSFSQFVSVMGTFSYAGADFTPKDVYSTIVSYLSTDSAPMCYTASDPVLNSTSWFVNYIGAFISFLSVDDLNAFGGTQLDIFTPDPTNLDLFQQFNVSQSVISEYVGLLYEVNPFFSSTLLPPLLRCVAPASGFTQLDSSQTMTMIKSLQEICSSLDPSVSAALAENMGSSVTAESIVALGNFITGLSTGQISSTSPSVLFSSLSVLSNVTGWNQAQDMAIIQILLNSGVFKITSSASLMQLGTLVAGIPSSVFTNINANEIRSAFQSQTFLTSISTAPTITQQTIVNQLVLLSSSSDGVVNSIPDSLSPFIPRNSLLSLSASSAMMVNKKQWKYEQAMLFFDTVAGAITDEDSISTNVLQGFTSTRVQFFDVVKVRKLIRGCRRRGNVKVVLQESQLTSMYSYIRNDIVTVFTDYPAELLLYYDYSLVNQSLCQDFFSALGYADFSVLSSTLSFKKQILFSSALQCLNISGSISRAQLDVLGNMTCLLNRTYIQNSDTYVLEKLKLCTGFSADQISAMENVLLTKNTTYGAPANWTITTLTSLGILPLYLTSTFWAQFTLKNKAQFMKTFLPILRAQPGVSNQMISSMMTEAKKTSRSQTRVLRAKRDTAAVTCTVGSISQVQASDASFPFNYDVTQFNVCLSVQVLKENLASISQKATGSDFQRVILDKLNQAYPAGISDEVLQVLGPASRAATVTDISGWNVTRVDTLSALMKSGDGIWTSDQVKAIVSKYLSVSGNSLGSLELNAIGGVNLCALDTSTISTISTANLQGAGSLSVSSCSSAQKQVFFSIAQTAFSDRAASTISPNAYQLIQNYLGGASLDYVRTLAASNVSMDLLTFTSLNSSVVNALTVSQVKGLLGTNLADLKTYEKNSVVQSWIGLQLQSDLNTLGIGLTGGRASNSSSIATTSSSSSSSSSASAGATAASTAKPTGSGSRIQALSKLHLLGFLAVVMATLTSAD